MSSAAEPIQFETDVTQVVQQTKDIKSVRFRRPDNFNYLSGQWIFVTLGRGADQKTKPLSISTSPTEDFLEVTKRLTGNEFSNILDALNVGDKAMIRGPYGNFTFQGEYDKVCMLSGGIGITPLRSMIRYAIDKGLKTDIVLLYSNRYVNDVAFKDDFEIMQRQNANLKVIYIITDPTQDWNGLIGRINRVMIENVVPDYRERVFYTSGPMPMVDAMRATLSEIGLPEKQVKQEYFTGYIGTP